MTVEAFNRAGTSRATATGTPQGKPDQVLLEGLTPSYRTISVNWKVPNNRGARITAFRVQWGVSAEDMFTKFITVDAKSNPPTSYTIAGLIPNTVYIVAVTAQNRIGVGQQSTINSTRTLGAESPESNDGCDYGRG